LRHRTVQVAAVDGADVARDAVLAPAEVVGRRDVREEAKVPLVAQVEACLDQACRLDDERRLAVRLDRLYEPWDGLVRQDATLLIS
jgi:hypothetical protein